MSKILITSALPYINGVPHLGHMVGCLLPSDVYARYMRMMGNEVLYICGNDEHDQDKKEHDCGREPRRSPPRRTRQLRWVRQLPSSDSKQRDHATR